MVSKVLVGLMLAGMLVLLSRYITAPEWWCHGTDIPTKALIGDCYVFGEVR